MQFVSLHNLQNALRNLAKDRIRVRFGSALGSGLDKISSHIFVTLRYRDKDPIVEKPGAVIIANYASVTIISNQRKIYMY